MAITKLIVGGFKSLKEPVEIPLAPITLVFGPNSAGKSAIHGALLELRRRLTRDKAKSKLSSAIQRFLNQDSVAHQLPRLDDLEEPSFTRVLLGCEIDDFIFPGSMELASATRWNGIGRDFYRSLEGKSVGYRLVGEAGDWTCAHEISVDGATVFEYMAPGALGGDKQVPGWPALHGFLGEHDEMLGLLSLHAGHAFWKSDEFQTLLTRLEDAVARSAGAWMRSAVWWDAGTLNVRLHAFNRQLDDWAEMNSDPYQGSPKLPDEIAAVNEPLSELCRVVNELVLQTEWAICQQVDIAHVSGSRQLLSEADVQTEWTGLDKVYSDEVPGSGLHDYAKWLGLVTAESDEIDVKQTTKSKDDFVNDVLSRNLFSARGYRVKAEVSVRTETMVVPRDATWSTDPEVSMQSTLYLQDEQGRALSFNQVGSGISYVLPVLTALWGAERSLIEQPELHLHPAAQCEMGDAVIRAFNRGRFSIIETHSEHLLLRVLKRIRQTSEQKAEDLELQCPPEAVVVLYFAPMADGTTQVNRLRVTRGGDFMDRWPDGFFEERSRELFDE